jgi:hypothetical protein
VEFPRITVAVVASAILLAGCSFDGDSLWPSLTGDEPTGQPAARVDIPPSQEERAAGPAYGQTAPTMMPMQPAPMQPMPMQMAAAPSASAGMPSTGTFVGSKVNSLRTELQRLKDQLAQQNGRLQQVRLSTTQNAQRYHGTVAAITARLQLGTTPGNPILVSQWNAAQAELDKVSADIGAMNALANDIASNSSLAAYVLESSRAAYGLSGAIDEDHRQLALLEDETNRTVVLIDRLLNEVNEDVARQTAYVGNERSNLTMLSSAIKNGELHGSSLLARAYATSSAPISFSTSTTPRSGFRPSGRNPLVVIRFDRPDVPYERALYTAVSKTLEARPDASFDLVGVSPAGGGSSDVALNQSRVKKYTNNVLKSLIDMGLPASRVSLAASTSPSVAANEVHLYVR